MIFKDKTILVTGSAGSIGSELARQVAKLKPERLLLCDQDETGIFHISQELEGSTPFVADITNKERIDEIFEQYKPNIVFQAAAYKHVPLMEMQVMEAVRNNIFGTLNVATLAAKHKVEKFVFVSTDKAVNPSSVMGATKRVGEMICQSLNGDTKFMSVRFGNVLDSRGNVLETWNRLIEQGKPIMVTHPEMKRYFMTKKEAVGLVLRAVEIGKGGEVFVFDMGEQKNILELAKEVVKKSGKNVKIVIGEPRPGEKLSEELINGRETATKHERIFIVKPQEVNVELLNAGLEALKTRKNIKQTFKKLIPDYKI